MTRFKIFKLMFGREEKCEETKGEKENENRLEFSLGTKERLGWISIKAYQILFSKCERKLNGMKS